MWFTPHVRHRIDGVEIPNILDNLCRTSLSSLLRNLLTTTEELRNQTLMDGFRTTFVSRLLNWKSLRQRHKDLFLVRISVAINQRSDKLCSTATMLWQLWVTILLWILSLIDWHFTTHQLYFRHIYADINNKI